MKEAGSRSNSGFSTKTRGLFSCWTAFFQKVRGFRGVLGNAKAYGCGNLSLILFSGYARRSFSLGPFLFRFVSDNRNLREVGASQNPFVTAADVNLFALPIPGDLGF